MLKKDILELCLFYLLEKQDRYGYEILRLLYEQFPDIQESAIYALLRNLCREEYLETYTGDISEGSIRKYYKMTEKGQKKLVDLLEQWHSLKKAMDELGIE